MKRVDLSIISAIRFYFNYKDSINEIRIISLHEINRELNKFEQERRQEKIREN
jgi:hypothetical protein